MSGRDTYGDYYFQGSRTVEKPGLQTADPRFCGGDDFSDATSGWNHGIADHSETSSRTPHGSTVRGRL